MNFKLTLTALALTVAMPTWAATVSITTPVKNYKPTPADMKAVVVMGPCLANNHVKLDATDSTNKVTDLVWAMCDSNSKYWAQINVSALKDGNIKLRAFQVVKTKTINAYQTIIKTTPVTATFKIESPAVNAQITSSNQAAVVVNGTCPQGAPVRYVATDSANKSTAIQWTDCNAYSDFHGQLDLSALKDGNITIKTMQDLNGVSKSLTVNVVKKTAVVVTPTPTPTPTPVPSANKIIFGVNGHDTTQTSYPLAQAEARFKILNARNLRSYRFDLLVGNTTVLDTLIPLAKKYNIILRPMIYPTTQAATYAFVKKYAADIKVWEIGNEQDYDKAGAQGRINTMVTTYKGVKQASDELNAGLKTTINVMACNSDDVSATARCPKDKLGAMWFLDMAKASGFNFDYISFHYYPHNGDKGYWMDMFYGQMRAMATKYNTKIFYNEVQCAEVYDGNTDGGYKGDNSCYDGVGIFLTELMSKYSDIVMELNIYEMVDEPDHPVTHEKHFGLMYDLNTPKPLMDLYTQFANF